MFDFVKFARDHPGISVNIEYWKNSPRGIVITLERLQPTIRRWRFCINEELYFENPHHLDVDGYIEMLLNKGLKDFYEREKEEHWLEDMPEYMPKFLGEPLRKEDTNDQD